MEHLWWLLLKLGDAVSNDSWWILNLILKRGYIGIQKYAVYSNKNLLRFYEFFSKHRSGNQF